MVLCRSLALASTDNAGRSFQSSGGGVSSSGGSVSLDLNQYVHWRAEKGNWGALLRVMGERMVPWCLYTKLYTVDTKRCTKHTAS